MRLRTLLAALALATPLSATAQLTFPSYFSSGAVLQREVAVPVWGRASTGAEVTVTLDGSTVSTETDAGGPWRVAFPARAAGGLHTMMVASGGQTRWMVVVR